MYRPGYDFLGFPATKQAAAMTHEEAGVKDPRKEISLAEVHDCFTSTEVTRQLQGRAGVSMLGDDPGSVRLATALVSWRAKMR